MTSQMQNSAADDVTDAVGAVVGAENGLDAIEDAVDVPGVLALLIGRWNRQFCSFWRQKWIEDGRIDLCEMK